MNDKDLELINNVISQAKFYLEEANEFYPFGTIVSNDNMIKPLGVYFNEEMPNSIDVIKHLEHAIQKGLKKGNYISGAIGVDVLLSKNSSYSSIQQNALEIRHYGNNNSLSKMYFKYTKVENDYVFEKYVE